MVIWTLALNTFREAVRDRVLPPSSFRRRHRLCIAGAQRCHVG